MHELSDYLVCVTDVFMVSVFFFFNLNLKPDKISGGKKDLPVAGLSFTRRRGQCIQQLLILFESLSETANQSSDRVTKPESNC